VTLIGKNQTPSNMPKKQKASYIADQKVVNIAQKEYQIEI
jgi:hypothetical protein